ncbi:MAG: hypothetical protein Q9160_005359 [Pyrenula sp. 1 TL-2023]
MGTFNDDLPERFHRAAPGIPEAGFKSSNITTASNRSLSKNIHEYIKASEIKADNPSEDWRSRSEIPTGQEILDLGNDPIALAPNRINRPWKSVNRYLEAHYELLREDTVANLRNAVAVIRESPNKMDDGEIAIYENVHIDGVTWAPQGLAFRLRFSLARAQKSIAWENSKRLVSGSLLALSPADDCFRTTCFPVVVAARPLSGVTLSPPEIDVFFGFRQNIRIDPQQEFIMVEAKSGYFEATRHTLRALQKLSKESFPLSDPICKLANAIPPPKHVTSSPELDIAAAYDSKKTGTDVKRVNVLDRWPRLTEQHVLDQSQWTALQTMLTKSLAIVQGPPGTGKTHVSVIGLRILVQNMGIDDPPIIVAAHTNHALDQLLRHLSPFLGEAYIRLGGRTKDPEIKKQSIFEVRQRTKVQGGASTLLPFSQRRLRDLTHAMVNTLSPMIQKDQQSPFAPAVLEDLEVLSHEQRTSLEDGAAQWTTTDNDSGTEDAISLWLSKALRSFDVVYRKPNFGFEEEEIDDLEYEQLKDLEAEHGVDEDDFDSLRGTYRRIADQFTANGSLSSASRRDAEKLLLETQNLWSIPAQTRGIVYLLMQEKAKQKMLEKFSEQARVYEKVAQDLKIGKWERDASILSKAKIIGMTTTGLSKYRPLVASLKPRIVLIEEAAECIEAPVTAACFDSLEHLILVGDHQQLQGNCSDRGLAGHPYNLEVSMFERLVTNQIPYNTLARQRRMDPEIRRLLQPIYGDKLQDHPSVLSRPNVPGMGDVRSFFFSHSWPESTDSQSSKFNENEADFIVGFYTYLTQNGVPTDGITILTFYNGQRKKILSKLRQNPSFAGNYLRVSTVDSYQGEENAVVLLSLVRSNHYSDERGIGFLAIANRICVALSRAKLGFYMFGNEKQLRRASALWNDIFGVIRTSPNRLGRKLPLQCRNHGRPTVVSDPHAWNSIFGGCDLDCHYTMRCGHSCPIRCHPFDHTIVLCKERCIRELPCGHTCDKLCSDDPCYCACEDFASIRGPQPLKKFPARNEEKISPIKQTETWLNSLKSRNHTDRTNAEAVKGIPQPAADGFTSPTHTPCTADQGMDGYGLHYDGGVSNRSNSHEKRSDNSYHSQEQQMASRTLWNDFAGGKVKDDDIKRDEEYKKALETRMSAVKEERADILVDFGGGAGILSEKVHDIPSHADGPIRTRYNHIYVSGLGYPRGQQEQTPAVAPVAEVSLLD